MAKKYSSLQSLAKGSGTPYGKSDPTSKTTNPTTFNVPYLQNTSPTYTERDGKSISNYVSASDVQSSAGLPCSPKHTLISGGEYVQGSFAIGSYSADHFREDQKFPSAIYVNKYVSDGVSSTGIDNTYQSVTAVEDIGGLYTDFSGTTQTYSIPTITILTGSDTSYYGAYSEPFVLVYHGRNLVPYAGIRKIRVTYSDTTTKDFDVMIPGWKNNIGIGQSLSQNASVNVMNTGGVSVQNCTSSWTMVGDGAIKAHSHSFSNINNAATPLFVGLGGGPGNHGLYNLNVTALGQHHNNSGLWSEGFQPDDNLTGASSYMTNAHQETWPLGLFYDMPVNEQSMLYFRSGGLASSDPLSIQQMWENQYAGSELTNITHPSTKRGNPLGADSEQHYELVQGYLLNGAVNAANRNFNSQVESSQLFNASGLTPNNSGTNTADDAGTWFSQIQVEMMSGVGSVWNNSSLGYNTHQGGEFDGFIGSPGNMAATPIFQHIQIYTKDLACACIVAPPPGGPTPLDLCNDPNALSYWGYSGVDCNFDPIPSDLWNGTATLGAYGCINCDYEVSNTSCASAAVASCDCTKTVAAPLAIISTPSAPSTLGGNDGVLNIEVTGGAEGFVYFIEPLGNTSAGLGVGAIENYTQTANSGTLTANGLNTYAYTSGSALGAGLKVEVDIVDYNTSPIFTLNKFLTRGKDYVPGENLILTDWSGATIEITVGTVAGVVVSPFSFNDGIRHYETTNATCGVTAIASGRKVTVGTNVFLQQEQQTGVNNYGSYMYDPMPVNLSFFPPSNTPFKSPDFFRSYAFDNSADNQIPITGLEAGDYKITVLERDRSCDGTNIQETLGCFLQANVNIPPGVSNTNGCTDNNIGTFDGEALNYDAAANTDDGSCIYCRAVDGKLVDNTSTELSVSGSTNPGDILTSTNNSTTIAATAAGSTADGSISYSRDLNSIMNYYAGLITNNSGSPNAEFKMELYSRASSAQTLTGASLVGAPVVNTPSQGFNKDFNNTSWSQGLTYGYYAIKSYVNDPQSVSEQEGCFQVDYFIIPVLACIIGQSGMQVGITIDNVTIADLDLVVASIPGNNLNPCTLQCCDAPIVTSYLIQTSPSCGTPAFNILQSCPNGIEQYITNTVHDIEFSSDNGVTWTSVWSNSVANTLNHGYTINIYNAYGPGDYRVAATRTFTWANGTTSQCIDNSNSVSLTADICGCTDPNSLNFDPLAVIDDGSCTYCVDGCMNPTSINYNSLATCDDGSCMGCVYGCMDPSATNYNAFATCDDGSCNYGVGCGCTDILADNYGKDCNGDIVGYPPPCDDGCCSYGGLFCDNPPNLDSVGTTDATCLPACSVTHTYGCTDPLASNYDATATFDDGTCTYCIYGCIDAAAANYDINATCDDGTCIPSTYGCTDPAALNYWPGATVDNGSCCYVSGCMTAGSSNFNPAACIDDGSCIACVYGCTDTLAINFDAAATCDDGSCVTGVLGCTDPTANNYDASATNDDGSCVYTGGCANPSASFVSLNGGTPQYGPLGGYATAGGFAEDTSGNLWVMGRTACVGMHGAGIMQYNSTTGNWDDNLGLGNFTPGATQNCCTLGTDVNTAPCNVKGPRAENLRIVFDSTNRIYAVLATISEARIMKQDTIGGGTFTNLTANNSVTGNGWNEPPAIVINSADEVFVHLYAGVFKYDGTGTGLSTAFSQILDHSTLTLGDVSPGNVSGGGLINNKNISVLFMNASDELFTVVRFIDPSGNTGGFVRVIKYSGSGSIWNAVGGDTTLNAAPFGVVATLNPQLVEDSNGNLYLMHHAGSKKAEVVKFPSGGSAWTTFSSNNVMLNYTTTRTGVGVSPSHDSATLDITSTDILVAAFVEQGGKTVRALRCDLNTPAKNWTYFTSTASAITGGSSNTGCKAKIFVTSSDEIYVLARNASTPRVYKLTNCDIDCTGTSAILDVNFEGYLEDLGYGNGTYADGLIDNTNVCTVTDLTMSSSTYFMDCLNYGGPYGVINSIAGIEAFSALETLTATFLGISVDPDLSNNIALTSIDISGNLFTGLDLSLLSNLGVVVNEGFGGSAPCLNTALLETLLLPTTSVMWRVAAAYQKLTTMDFANQTYMEDIFLQNNLLTSITNLADCTILKWVDVRDNQLTSINISNNHLVTKLYATNMPTLTSVTLGNGINLNTLILQTGGSASNLVIHVGNSAGRVALAQSLFTVGNNSISAGTTFVV